MTAKQTYVGPALTITQIKTLKPCSLNGRLGSMKPRKAYTIGEALEAGVTIDSLVWVIHRIAYRWSEPMVVDDPELKRRYYGYELDNNKLINVGVDSALSRSMCFKKWFIKLKPTPYKITGLEEQIKVFNVAAHKFDKKYRILDRQEYVQEKKLEAETIRKRKAMHATLEAKRKMLDKSLAVVERAASKKTKALVKQFLKEQNNASR